MLCLLLFICYALASEDRPTTQENIYDGEFADQVMISFPRDNKTDSELTLLELLDRKICKILMDPYGITGRVVCDNDGEMLVEDVMLFEKYVKRAKKMWMDKTVKRDEALMKSVNVMFDKGWPQFMILTVEDDGEHLMKGLKLNVSEVYEFYEYRSRANEEWDDLRSMIECQ